MGSSRSDLSNQTACLLPPVRFGRGAQDLFHGDLLQLERFHGAQATDRSSGGGTDALESPNQEQRPADEIVAHRSQRQLPAHGKGPRAGSGEIIQTYPVSDLYGEPKLGSVLADNVESVSDGCTRLRASPQSEEVQRYVAEIQNEIVVQLKPEITGLADDTFDTTPAPGPHYLIGIRPTKESLEAPSRDVQPVLLQTLAEHGRRPYRRLCTDDVRRSHQDTLVSKLAQPVPIGVGPRVQKRFGHAFRVLRRPVIDIRRAVGLGWTEQPTGVRIDGFAGTLCKYDLPSE